MNTPYFIARKIARPKRRSFSSFIVTIATIAVALSVTVMVVASSMVNGFTNEIANKVFGFWGHIHIEDLTGSSLIDQNALILDDELLSSIRDIDGVESVEPFATKPGIIKTADQLERIFLKGVGADYHWQFFESHLVEGKLPNTADTVVSRNLLISETTSKRMELNAGDRVDLYFIRDGNKRPIGRRFEISGVYNSGLEEFDALFAIGDIRVVQQLNQWKESEVGSYEVLIDDVARLDHLDAEIYYKYLPTEIRSMTIKDLRPNIFDWLELQSFTGNIFLVFMLVIAILNMVIALLILILDRTYMIGTMKALGGSNGLLQKIFLYCSSFIIIRGLIIGNAIGLGICFFQKYTGLIQLPEDSYYVKVAPVLIDWWMILLINAGTIGICLVFLILPSLLIMRISPIKAIRFS